MKQAAYPMKKTPLLNADLITYQNRGVFKFILFTPFYGLNFVNEYVIYMLLLKGGKRIAETVEILLIKQSERRISVIFQRYARLPFEHCFLREAIGSLKPLKF